MFVPLTPLEFRRRAVHLFPNVVGVVDGERRFTYAQYDERVNRLANGLRDLGVRPGEIISFLTYNTHHLLEGYYGVVQAGAVLNPINTRMGPAEISYILDHSASTVVFAHADFAPIVRAQSSRLPALRHIVVMEGEPQPGEHEYEALLAAASPAHVAEEVSDENAMCELFYTSGTTGMPKGVALSHRSLYLHAMTFISGFQIGPDDVFLHIVPLFHVNGWGTPQFLTAVGGKHVMLRRVAPDEICRLVEQERVTRLFGVPAVMNGLINFKDLAKYDLSSLKQIAMGGAPSSFALVDRLERTFGCQVNGIYGLSETSPVIVSAAPKLSMRDLPDEQRRHYQARTGFELIGTHLRVVDPDGSDVAPDGQQVGEIVVRSNLVMTGYYKDEVATKRAIRDGWFYTGDLAVIDQEGSILIVDRAKDIIISGGENISSPEVEATLFLHPAVFECAVIGVPDERWGEVPKAIVVLKPGAEASEQELIDHCRAHLGHYKCPRTVEFSAELPKSGTGKILKRDLREPYWAGREKRVS
ncbi:MAG: long-chain-fatty-acid--CoA ligase [Chloroflexales bacterium]|nr:long-chain-fatty-acid--CoA ligase [Chloroflexales bacterium]